MPAIFLSYRRKDQPGFVGRLHDRLLEAFGDQCSVFMDVNTIRGGAYFDDVILKQIAQSNIVLALIGDRWSSDGRLFANDDFVRLELREALKKPGRTIPVLIDDRSPPGSSDLPDDLSELARVQAWKIYHASFDADAKSVTKKLRHLLRLWDEETFFEVLPSSALKERYRMIIDWAKSNRLPISWGNAQNGSLLIATKRSKKTLFSFDGGGTSFISFSALQDAGHYHDENARRNLIGAINMIRHLNVAADRVHAKEFGYQIANVELDEMPSLLRLFSDLSEPSASA